MKKKNLLIIGGTGFFGKSIIEYLNKNLSLKKKINNIIVISKNKKKNINKNKNKNIKITYLKKNKKNIKKIT